MVFMQSYLFLEIPNWWSPNNQADMMKTCERRTRTVMLKDRRKEKIPDISYDLDGDGSVNVRDYALAKMFDKDGDGKLNKAEFKAAIKALEDGFEEKFMWGLEQSGSLKEHLRIMQKRGKICVGEDYTKLTETYPVHSLTMEPRRHENRQDMMQKRREGLVDEIVKERELWDSANPYWIDRKYIKPEGYTDNPLYQSIKQVKKEKRRNERLIAGLTAETQFITDNSKDPGVTYVKKPVPNCQSELNLARKK